MEYEDGRENLWVTRKIRTSLIKWISILWMKLMLWWTLPLVRFRANWDERTSLAFSVIIPADGTWTNFTYNHAAKKEGILRFRPCLLKW
jgi:hypothetical protein